jgi:tetratricopeptide (TPR) repeat protein/energy-coupling factor transporter ATP-binding protein EcfA2
MITVSDNGAEAPGAPYTSFRFIKEAHEQLRNRVRDGEEPQRLLSDVENFVNRGSMAGAYLDSIDDRMAAQGMLDYWVPMLFRSNRTPPDTTLVEFDPTTSPILDDSKCPYLGLNAFQEENSHLFHGRVRLVEMLFKKTQSSRLVFVLGPSGSGKSSLVLAGLIPRLKKESEESSAGDRFFQRHVPGSNPLRSLSETLRSFYDETPEWAAEQARVMLEDSGHLTRLVSERGRGRAVFVVDQFEESFTLCLDDALREAYIGNLTTLASARGAGHLVILTMRSDYETYVVQAPALVPYFVDENLFRVSTLMSDDLRQAIEEPARDIGLKFDEGIVDALVKDILGEPAGLPLLQFTLLRLWKMREGGRSRITWESYRKLGNARRALALTADEFFNALSDENKAIVKRILMRMVRPSGVAETVSNRVRRSSLNVGAPELVEGALGALHEAGLVRITPGVTQGNDQIEVAHEALVRNWPQLVDWVEKDRVFMRQRLRLTATAEQWLEHGKDPGGLLAGKLLEEAQQYDAAELNELEREFVQASIDAEETTAREKAEAAERERQLEREKMLALELKAAEEAKNVRLEREKVLALEQKAEEESKNVRLEREKVIALEQKAAEEAKNGRRLRIFVPVLAILALLALATAAFAVMSASRARASEALARAKEGLAHEKESEAQVSRDTAEMERQRAEAESKKVLGLLAETKAAKDKAEKASEEAKKQAKIAEENSKKLTAAQKDLIAKQTELNELNEKNKTRADRAELAEQLGTATKLIDRDQDKALELLNTLFVRFEQQKKYDPDGLKAVDALSGQAKAHYLLSVKKSRVGDEKGAQDETAFAKKAYDAAIARLNQKLTDAEKIAGADGPDLVPLLEGRAQFYEFHKYNPEFADNALADYLRALDIQEKSFKGDMNVWQLYDSLRDYDRLTEEVAEFYRDDSDDLEKLYERVVAFKKKVDPNPTISDDLRVAYNQLAQVEDDNRKWDKAEANYREALKIVEAAYGPTYPTPLLSASLKNLAGVLARPRESDKEAKEKRRESVELYKRAIDVLVARGESTASEVAQIRLKLASTLGDSDEAVANALEATRFYESAQGEGKGGLIAALRSLSQLYIDRKEFDKAEPVLQKLLPLLKDETGGIAVDYTSTSMKLGTALMENGKLKEAEGQYTSLIADLSKIPGNTALVRKGDALLGLADVYRRAQRYDKAEKAAAETLKIATAVRNPLRVIKASDSTAETYKAQARYAEAETQYKQALEKFGAQERLFYPKVLTDVMEHYADLLDKMKRTAESESLRAQVKALKEKSEQP